MGAGGTAELSLLLLSRTPACSEYVQSYSIWAFPHPNACSIQCLQVNEKHQSVNPRHISLYHELVNYLCAYYTEIEENSVGGREPYML